MSPLFSKKESITLEEFVSVAIQTAFEYPTAENLQRVDTGQVLSEKEVSDVRKGVPSLILAINQMLLMIEAENGKVKRFKGDSQHDIAETVSYGFGVTSGKYLESTGLSHDKAADEAEKVGNQCLQYLQKATQNLPDNAPVQDIFFQYCKLFADNILAGSQDTDKHFIVFDFAKQLYRNIESGFNNLKIS